MSIKSYLKPQSVTAALLMAKAHENYLYFAGGTDIQVYLKQQLKKPDHIIDLSDIGELQNITSNDENISVGSMTSLDTVSKNNLIEKDFPLITEAAQSIATPVIRKTATVGGNILVNNRCNFYNQSFGWRQAIGSCLRDVGDICQVTNKSGKCFSRNVSDLAAALFCLDARVIISNQNEVLELSIVDLYNQDGIDFHKHLDHDGILTKIILPNSTGSTWYKKLRIRNTLDFSSLTIAAKVLDNKNFRIGLNGVSMSPVLITGNLEMIDLEGIKSLARKSCKTVDNDMMPLKYRRQMIEVYLDQWWESI
jgi:4-hydroxybenzoyl-CoA reductase subunit beta